MNIQPQMNVHIYYSKNKPRQAHKKISFLQIGLNGQKLAPLAHPIMKRELMENNKNVEVFFRIQ